MFACLDQQPHHACSPLQMEDLSAELDALGGGSARVSQYRVIAVCGAPHPQPSASAEQRGRDPTPPPSIVQFEGSTVCVRDPRAPADTPAAQCVRRYTLPACVAADSDPHGRAFDSAVSEGVATALLNGFSSTLVSFGQSGVGKTVRLLGRHGLSCASESAGALPRILAALLEEAASEYDSHQIGVSSWELVHDQVRSSNPRLTAKARRRLGCQFQRRPHGQQLTVSERSHAG